jgi:hypothetical protein
VSTVVTIALLAYAAVLALTLAALTAAKRGDAAMSRAARERPERGAPPARLPPHAAPVAISAASDPARRLAADVVGALGVERVIVLLQRPGGSAVAACGGVPTEMLGQRLPALVGADGAEGARVLMRRTAGDVPLSVASVPIEAEGRSIGVVAVGTRRITARDLDFLRRLVGRAGRQMASGGPPPSWPDAA